MTKVTICNGTLKDARIPERWESSRDFSLANEHVAHMLLGPSGVALAMDMADKLVQNWS